MATSDAEQKSVNVNQHKRMAMGAPIQGSSMGGSTGSESKSQSSSESKPRVGALMQAKKK
jgi:hypothetical protein